jgi:branched-chain amino acid transport system permease protein
MHIPLKKPIGLLVLFIFIVALPLLVDSPYFVHLMIMVGMNSVLAMTFIMLLRAGLLNLSVAAFWGIGAYASATLVTKLGLSVWLALPASTAITGILAFLVGIILIRSGGFGFVMLSALAGMVTVLVFGTFDVFGGYVGIANIPPPEPITLPFFGTVAFASKVPYYYLMLFLFMLVVTVFSAFYAAWSGRAWRAIDLSPPLAMTLGIDIFRYRLLAFVVASATAGLMGWFYVGYFGAVLPSTFDMFKTFNIQIYAILGGLGSAFLGPVVGTFVMTAVPEFLRIAKDIEPIYTGFLLIVLVLFFPDGLMSLSSYWRRSEGGPEGIARIGRWAKALLSVGNKV